MELNIVVSLVIGYGAIAIITGLIIWIKLIQEEGPLDTSDYIMMSTFVLLICLIGGFFWPAVGLMYLLKRE
jgi:cytochrome b subunit of formate dehydrogenase